MIRSPRATSNASAITAAATAILLTPMATADWQVVDLGPAGLDGQLFGVHQGRQAGIVIEGFTTRAAVWSGDAASFVDLDGGAFPFGSRADAVFGSSIVGSTFVFDEKLEEDFSNAALWIDGPGGYVNLHPADPAILGSQANAVHGDRQGGTIRTIDEEDHAAIWSGTAESLVDIHPPSATSSYIHGMWGDQQVGYATGLPLSHAGVWTGTAESFVDLHPDQFGPDASQGWNTDGTQQVGWMTFVNQGFTNNPVVWSGTAESAVNLLPAGWVSGQAFGVFGGRQVGSARAADGEDLRAIVWDGSADAFTDLHALLPEGIYRRSSAQAIWNDGTNWYAVGIGVRFDFTSDPIMWVQPMDGGPACVGDFDEDGAVTFLDLTTQLANWGPCDACPEDLDGNGSVDFGDLVDLLAVWGPCA